MSFRRKTRGQAVAEIAFAIPVLMMLLFGAFHVARVFYIYHTLHNAVRGGAGLLARTSNINYCDAADPTLLDAKNFIVYGNLQGTGQPIVTGLTTDNILIFPERTPTGTLAVAECICAEEDSCDIANGGRAPDYVTVTLGPGFPMDVRFPFVSWGTINLRVSVRMAVTGG